MLNRSTVVHHSLKDLVVQRIRRAILDGKLGLGARLVETTVADQLGVSRGPVREAFLDLAREGLLILSPRKGAWVSTLEPADMWQIYTLRGHLEVLLVRHGLKNMGPTDFDYLERLVEEMGKLTDGPGQISRATELDLAFHGRIAAACPHPRIVEQYRTMDGLVGAGIYSVINLLKSTVRQMKVMHEPVLRALRTRDIEVAEKAVQAHWSDTAARMQHLSRVRVEQS